MGINRTEMRGYVTNDLLFMDLLKIVNKITKELKRQKFSDISPIKWSLAVWFNTTKMHVDLLPLMNRI